MTLYHTFGPFIIPRRTSPSGNKVLDSSAESISAFWDVVDKKRRQLSTACGCYIFAIRAGGGIKPWYVGQSKTGFRNECFQPSKVNHYHDIVNNSLKGTPVLIFVARHTTAGNLSTTLSIREANFVEQYLISFALWNNPALKNIKNTSYLRTLQIPGILNNPTGKPSAGAALLQRTLGV